METRTATNAASNVAAIVESAIKGECTTITKNGKPKAVVIPVELWERLNSPLDLLGDDEPTQEWDPERLALLERIKELEGSLP